MKQIKIVAARLAQSRAGKAVVGVVATVSAAAAQAAPVDVSALGTAVDLSTINTTIGAVFTSIITVVAFVWAGYKIVRMFKGA